MRSSWPAGRWAPGLVPWLLEALQDERALVRARACRGLAALEATSSEVVTALTRSLQDDQGHVRYAAARALLELHPGDAELERRCREMLAELGARP